MVKYLNIPGAKKALKLDKNAPNYVYCAKKNSCALFITSLHSLKIRNLQNFLYT